MPAIRVEGLGKRYRLAHGQERAAYRTLRDSIMKFVTAPLRKRGTVEEFWALNDVSFEVQPGEVVGIIGRNGAGKSTLLKILSRITKPTTGKVEINGRVGSLLEVGTGFHPELTGRENVYLNGSILGMSHKEIEKKFDEIVAFAEVEKFLDTPVKRYSSGMYVRLAFAVAAHLEPEILIVDEVLSVGDYAFQAKSRARMEEMRDSGRTIVFVSHNLQAVTELCNTAIVLNEGQIVFSGSTDKAIKEYCRFQSGTRSTGSVRGGINRAIENRVIIGGASITRFELINAVGKASNVFHSNEHIRCEMEVHFYEDSENPHPACFVKNLQGLCLYDINSVWKKIQTGNFVKGQSYIFVWSLQCHLLPGQYFLGGDLARGDLTGYYDRSDPGLTFEVINDGGAKGLSDLEAELSIQSVLEMTTQVP
jgi:ABC-type polysaccharide/polyol phosphate transport system ATPase subunit